MDGRLAEGIALFNSARYFEAHEVFEELWRSAAGDRRLLFQGLTQICAGMVKHRRDQIGPARTLLARGLRKLEIADLSSLPELMLAPFADHVREILAALESGADFAPPALRAAGSDV